MNTDLEHSVSKEGDTTAISLRLGPVDVQIRFPSPLRRKAAETFEELAGDLRGDHD